MDEDRKDLVLLLLREGSRRDAVRLYHEETGVDMEQARAAVAELSRQHGIAGQSGRWVPAVVITLVLLASILLAL